MDLFDNPFYILGATTHDDRHRLVELAEEKSLLLDPNLVSQARADLTNPRKRLAAEIAWLPGLGSKRVEGLLDKAQNDPIAIRSAKNVSPLAKVNLLMSSFSHMTDGTPYASVAWIAEIADEFDKISAEDLYDQINKEREAAGFPAVADISVVSNEIEEHRASIASRLSESMRRFNGDTFIDVTTEIIESTTDIGDRAALTLVVDIIDAYEVDIQDQMTQAANAVEEMIDSIRSLLDAGRPETDINTSVSRLIDAVEHWDRYAQPIQVCRKSQGLRHDDSFGMAGKVRSLAIDLHNKYSMTGLSKRISDMMSKVFDEVVEIAEMASKDSKTLADITKKQQGDLARFSKYKFNASSFTYDNTTIMLKDITSVGLYRCVTSHKSAFITVKKTEKVEVYVFSSTGRSITIKYDENGGLFFGDKKEDIENAVEFFLRLAAMTFEQRKKRYEDQVNQYGYFDLLECRVYPYNKIVHKGKEYMLDSSSFYTGYGFIEIKDDREKGSMKSLFSSSSFRIPTICDQDVIYYLLGTYCGIRFR